MDCVRRLPLNRVINVGGGGKKVCMYVCMYIAVFPVLGMKCVLGCRQIILLELCWTFSLERVRVLNNSPFQYPFLVQTPTIRSSTIYSMYSRWDDKDSVIFFYICFVN